METTKPEWQYMCWHHGLLNILSSPLRTTAQKKRLLSKYYCFWQCSWLPKNSDRDVKYYNVFRPVKTTCILQSMDQGVISTFKSYYLRNTFCEAIPAMDNDSSNGTGQNQLKTFWEDFTILDAIKDIHDSWENIKISTWTGVWKNLTPTLMDDFGSWLQWRK